MELERMQWLKPACCPEDLCLITSIHIRWLTTGYNSSSKGSDDPPLCLITFIHMQVYIKYIKNYFQSGAYVCLIKNK